MNIETVLSRNPEVLSGAAVFPGTRVPVRSLIEHLRAGDTIDDFLEGFPTVTRAQAEALLDAALNSLLEEWEHAHPAR